VPIRGNHIYRRRTSERLHVQVRNLADKVVSVSQISAGLRCHVGRGQPPDNKNDGCRRSYHPSQPETALRFARNTLFYPLPKVRARGEAFSGSLNRPLHLYARKGSRAHEHRSCVFRAPQAHRRDKYLALTSKTHKPWFTFDSFHLETEAAGRRGVPFWHVINATSPCPSGWQVWRDFLIRHLFDFMQE